MPTPDQIAALRYRAYLETWLLANAGGHARLGAPAFARQNTVVTDALGPDGYTWAQGQALTVDKHGKLIALAQKHSAGHQWVYSNDDGGTWADSTLSEGFLTRGSVAYDPRNDLLHVLWVAQAGSDGVIYRRYTIQRDAGNNITGFTRDANVNLQLEFHTTSANNYYQPVALWLDDGGFGQYGALVAAWVTQSSTQGQVHASMRTLSNTADDNSAANWRSPTGTNDANGMGGTVAVPFANLSPARNAAAGLTVARRRAGTRAKDLAVVYAFKGDSVYARRLPWDGTNLRWGAPTAELTVSALNRQGTETGGQAHELLSKLAEDERRARLWLGFANWKGGETWSLVSLGDDDTASAPLDVHTVGGDGVFQPADYALAGDVVFDQAAGLVVSAHVASGTGTNDVVITTYDRDRALVQRDTVFTAADCDIPLLWADPLTGATRRTVGGKDRLLALFRDTDGYPATAPPYRGWFGTLRWE